MHLAGSRSWPQDAPVADRSADSALLPCTSLPRYSVPAIRQSTRHIGRPTSACRQAMAQARRGFRFACCVETYHFGRYAAAGAADRGEVDGTTLHCSALTGPATAPATQPSAGKSARSGGVMHHNFFMQCLSGWLTGCGCHLTLCARRARLFRPHFSLLYCGSLALAHLPPVQSLHRGSPERNQPDGRKSRLGQTTTSMPGSDVPGQFFLYSSPS